MIRFHCEECDVRIKVRDGAEGRKVRCPRCGAAQLVPDGEPARDEAVAVDEATSLNDLAAAVNVSPSAHATDATPAEPHRSSRRPATSRPPHPEPEDEPDSLFEPEDDARSPDAEPSPHYDEGSDDPVDDDPLAALAAQAGDGDPNSMTMMEQALHEVNDKPPLKDEFTAHAPAGKNGKKDTLSDTQAIPRQKRAQRSPISSPRHSEVSRSKPIRASLKPVDDQALEDLKSSAHRGRPVPQPTHADVSPPRGKTNDRGSRAGQRAKHDHPGRSGVRSTQSPERSASTADSRAIPLSSSSRPPSKRRMQAQPIPIHDGPSHGGAARRSHAKPPSYPALAMAGWLLRLLAMLAIGGAVKLVMMSIDQQQTIVTRLLIILGGVIGVVVVWGLGEITLAVRRIAQNTHHPG